MTQTRKRFSFTN